MKIRNPVAKNMRGKGGPFKDRKTDGRSFKKQKIKKELDQTDEEWINDELTDYLKDNDTSH